MLLTILATYVVVVALGDNRYAGAVRLAMLGVVLVMAMRLRRRTWGWARLAGVVVAAALVASIGASLAGADSVGVALSSCVVMVLVVTSIANIAQFLWPRPAADVQSVGGALSAYLLLALFFAATHQLLAAALGQPYLNGVNTELDGAAYLYFSVITLTTVGFGDITPGCDAARSVAMAEALVGQLYLVAVVGAVVGNVARRNRDRRDGNPDEQ
jgi:hypothetical protein